MINVNGTICNTEEELEAAIIDLPEDQKFYIRNDFYGCPNPTVPLDQLQLLAVNDILTKAINFGQSMILNFASENILMGITQLGMTSAVRDATSKVVAALQTGSLYDAILEAKAIPAEKKDAVFVTDARLLVFINKIEAYLGIPLSTSL